MSAILAVPVSDAVLARLEQQSARSGTTPELMAAEQLVLAMPPSTSDTLLACADMVESNAPVAAERGSTPEPIASPDREKAGLPPGYSRLARLAGTLRSDRDVEGHPGHR